MAASDGGATPLQNAMKMAKVAIQLDGGNQHKEAYCEYLRTISYISHALLEKAVTQKEKEVVEEERMLMLAEQCLERAKSFIGKSSEPQHPAAPNTALPRQLPVETSHKATSPTASGQCRELPDAGGQLSPFVPPEVFHELQTVEPPDTGRRELTPIEQASRLNQKLKANYEARLARLTPAQVYQKTSLTLSLQRQMMENLIIAKARQDALQRKMEERRLRLQEEANRRFAASGAVTAEEQEQRTLYTNVLEYEQDHDWPKLWKANIQENPDSITLVSHLVSYLLRVSPDTRLFPSTDYNYITEINQSDHPVMKLLRRHQYRIYNRLYPIVSKRFPQSPALPLRASHHMLHPETPRKPTRTVSSSGQSFSTDSSLSRDLHTNYDDEDLEEPPTEVTVDRENSFEDLEQFLTQLDWAPPHSSTDDTGSDTETTCDASSLDESHIQEMEMRALKEHLKSIVKDIHIAVDQLLSLCLLSFECLNTARFKDLCLASIEEAFFTPLWSALVALFRKVNRDREQACEASMKLYQDALPGDVGVPLKLFPQDPCIQGSYPYESAVHELKLVFKDGCPQRKLECIVRTLRQICACAEEYRCVHEADATPTTAAIGADDLLPILSFVALRSQCPQLVSECAALEEFIHEGYLIGEEGYCLTSMQSALAYVESLHLGAQLPDALT